MSLKLLPFEITCKIVQDIDNPYALAQMDKYCRGVVYNDLIITFFLKEVHARLKFDIILADASQLESPLKYKILIILQRTQIQEVKALGYRNFNPYNIFLLQQVLPNFDNFKTINFLFLSTINKHCINAFNGILYSDLNKDLTTYDLYSALLHAAKNGKISFMVSLLASPRISELKSEHFGEALLFATNAKHTEIVSILLNCSEAERIPPYQLEFAYLTAAGFQIYIYNQQCIPSMEDPSDFNPEFIKIFHDSKIAHKLPYHQRREIDNLQQQMTDEKLKLSHLTPRAISEYLPEEESRLYYLNKSHTVQEYLFETELKSFSDELISSLLK